MKKKIVSLLLAAAMTMSVMSPFAGTAFAEEAAEQSVGVQVEAVQATEETADGEEPAVEQEEQKQAAEQQEDSEAVRQAGALLEALPKAEDVAAMSAEDKAKVSEQMPR